VLTGPEKHTAILVFTLKPSSWFRSVVFTHAVDVDDGVQPAGSGRLTCSPVCWVDIETVYTFEGNGPTVGDDGLNRTVVAPHKSDNGARKRKILKTFIIYLPSIHDLCSIR
jgi:hypothetical protein